MSFRTHLKITFVVDIQMNKPKEKWGEHRILPIFAPICHFFDLSKYHRTPSGQRKCHPAPFSKVCQFVEKSFDKLTQKTASVSRGGYNFYKNRLQFNGSNDGIFRTFFHCNLQDFQSVFGINHTVTGNFCAKKLVFG